MDEIISVFGISKKIAMRRSDLGEFEEIVLLTVAATFPMAYSVAIAEDLEKETGFPVSTGAVHAALQRLEQKGYLTSYLGEATQERGGRRKRLFTITSYGGKILSEVRMLRENLWKRIEPEILTKAGLNFS
jgi:PadR family transcriptional regulator PadR